jgi:hypothetical protein
MFFISQAAKEAFVQFWEDVDNAPVIPGCMTTDPELWFQEQQGPTYRLARQLCQRCPVKASCLTMALENEEQFGMWGGLSPHERRRLKRQIGLHQRGRGRPKSV